MRDDFPSGTKDELAKRVAFLCSNPRCRQPTSGPQTGPSGTVNVGIAAHITAASAGGPRYNPALSVNERTCSENAIWLCQTCAKLIDNDLPGYSTDKLTEWKSDAEAAARRALERRQAPATESEGVFLEAERLMPALLAEMRTDVRGDASGLVREFVVLSNPNVLFVDGRLHFTYFANVHRNALIEVDWLEEMGLVTIVPARKRPVYRMTPEFARWLGSVK